MLDKRIKELIIKVIGDMTIDSYEGLTSVRLFSYLFNDIGFMYSLNREDDTYKVSLTDTNEPLIEGRNKIIDSCKTINNIVKAFDGIKFQLHRHYMFIVGDHIVMRASIDSSNYGAIDELEIVTNREDLDFISKLLVESISIKDVVNDENSYRIAYKGQYSIETSVYKFHDWHSNIKENYNDDVPYEEMNSIIKSDKASLMLLYGKPGTGKTSLIKSLINDNRERNFIFIDTALCESISNGEFLDFLLENKNSIIVFEDCEKLLQSRDMNINNSIGTILNLTDGIIAESMTIKFICTFNCDLNKVDEAILRKGRLSLKYEFKELSLEKTKAIYPEAKEPMTLADAHNATIKNDFSEKKTKKIGFC